jgi:hypothetical protein
VRWWPWRRRAQAEPPEQEVPDVSPQASPETLKARAAAQAAAQRLHESKERRVEVDARVTAIVRLNKDNGFGDMIWEAFRGGE